MARPPDAAWTTADFKLRHQSSADGKLRHQSSADGKLRHQSSVDDILLHQMSACSSINNSPLPGIHGTLCAMRMGRLFSIILMALLGMLLMSTVNCLGENWRK